MARNLFVGGCVDGDVIETGAEDYRMAAKMPTMELAATQDFAAFEAATTADRYHKVTLIAGGSKVDIYLHDQIARKAQSRGELEELALHALINGYGGKREDEQRRRPPVPSGGTLRGEPAPSRAGMESATAKGDDGLSQFQREAMEMIKQVMASGAKMEVTSKPRSLGQQQELERMAQQASGLNEVIGEFLGQPVTLGEILQMPMREGCDCPICRMMRMGGTAGPEERRFIRDMLARVERDTMMKAMQAPEWATDFGQAEARMYRMRMEEPRIKTLPPPPPKAFDYREKNAAPKSVRKGK